MKAKQISLAHYPAPLRLAALLLTLLLAWLPFAVPIYLLVGDRNLVTILTMGLLYLEFVFLVQWWGQKVYGRSAILRSYGLQVTQQNAKDLGSGLILGLLFTLALFGVEGQLGWLVWQHPTIFLPRLILEGLASAIGIGLAEELLFRGWLLDELQQDYRPNVVLWADATVFACLHYIKPIAEVERTWLEFPALVLLGLTLVWAKWAHQGRLGTSIGLHAGLVWGYYIINVGQMVKYSSQVPNWITGIDGNPLIGIMGLMFLSLLAVWMRWRWHLARSQSRTD